MKNQKRPPRGKPCSIIRVAGIFREKKVLHPLFCFCVGCSASKWSVNSPLSLPNKVISANTEWNSAEMIQYRVKIDENKEIRRVFIRKQRRTRAFQQIRRVFKAICGNTQRNLSFSIKFLVSFGEIGENTRKSWKTLAYIYI